MRFRRVRRSVVGDGASEHTKMKTLNWVDGYGWTKKTLRNFFQSYFGNYKSFELIFSLDSTQLRAAVVTTLKSVRKLLEPFLNCVGLYYLKNLKASNYLAADPSNISPELLNCCENPSKGYCSCIIVVSTNCWRPIASSTRLRFGSSPAIGRRVRPGTALILRLALMCKCYRRLSGSWRED